MNRRLFFGTLTGLLATPALATPRQADPSPSVDFPPWLAAWKDLPQIPVWSCDDPVASALISAVKEQRPLLLRYRGGSTPGMSRRFTPAQVFRVADSDSAPLYVSGWCQQRQQHRTLRLDRISWAGTEEV